MTIRKIFISLVIVTLVALAFVSCSGTKSICPAYSNTVTETTTNPNS